MSHLRFKKLAFVATSFLLISLILPTQPKAAETAEEEWQLSQDVQESWQAFKSFSYEQKEKALAAGEDLLASLDRQLETMEQRLAEASDNAAASWSERKDDLQALRDRLATNLEALEQSSADAYETVKTEVGEAYEATTTAMADAWNELTN
ncbi:MAG: hypothetical protein ACFB6S_04885 [Geminicoccaceae bacterium]